MQVFVRDDSSAAISGASVTVTISAGTLLQGASPYTAATAADGKLTLNFFPPTTPGTVTVNASAKVGSGTAVNATSKTFTISGAGCSGASTPTTVAPVPTQATALLTAPRTGDAGLAGNGTSWTLYAALALVVGSLAGAVAVYKARS